MVDKLVQRPGRRNRSLGRGENGGEEVRNGREKRKKIQREQFRTRYVRYPQKPGLKNLRALKVWEFIEAEDKRGATPKSSSTMAPI